MIICYDQRTQSGCLRANPNTAQNCRECGRSLRFALQFHDPGAEIEQLRILRLIGHGAFGAVYEAEVIGRSGLHVALKESFDHEAMEDLRREFAILHNLKHDNLPGYYRVFALNGHGYLVMEYVPGQSLHEILHAAGGPLRENQVLGYVVQLCDVLTFLHSQNPPLLHRDIKPANIRLTPQGLIKLVDFGLIKQYGQQTRPSLRGFGTLAYAPFEQFGNSGTEPRSDLYSLAGTIYHLLTGQEPATVPERLSGGVDGLIPPLHLNPRLSAHVAEALIRGLNILPRDRFEHAGEFKAALLGLQPASQLPATAPLSDAAAGSSLPWPEPPADKPAGGLPWPQPAPEKKSPSGGLPWPQQPAVPPAPEKPDSGLPWPEPE